MAHGARVDAVDIDRTTGTIRVHLTEGPLPLPLPGSTGAITGTMEFTGTSLAEAITAAQERITQDLKFLVLAEWLRRDPGLANPGLVRLKGKAVDLDGLSATIVDL